MLIPLISSAAIGLMFVLVFYLGFKLGEKNRHTERIEERIIEKAIKVKGEDFTPDDERDYFEELESKKEKK